MFAPVPISPHPPFSTKALGPQPPTADFSGTPVSGTIPLSVTLTDLSTGSPTSWSWDFGDGNTSTTQSPVNVYSVAGTYTVKLTATNANGSNTKTRTNYITATVPVPVADFSGTPLSGNAPLTVAFTDLSTNTPTSWAWTFGDGGTSTAQNPSHNYAVAGTYSVGLTATNAGGSNLKTRNAYISVTSSVIPGRSGLGGDDVPRYVRSPHKGWNRDEWKRSIKDGEDGIATTLQATYDRLIGREPPLTVLAQVDAIVRPIAKQESRDTPLRIDWQRMAADFERANRLMALAREEAELQAAIEDDDDVMLLIQ